MRQIPLLLFLLITAPVTAQEAFFFDPNSASPSGGDVIRFVANDPALDFRSGNPEVFFDGIAAMNVIVVDAHTLTAVAPPHAEGVVRVALRLNGMTYTTERNFGYARFRYPILIPVANETAGAFGARWTTDIWVYNDSDEPVNVFPEVCFFIGAVFPCGESLIVAPHGSARVPPRGFPEMYLFPPNDVRDRLHFNVRVRDASRSDAGTEIPIVPVSQYRDRRVVLVNVPVNDRLRSMLRIYDQEIVAGNSIGVRVFDAATGTLLTQRDTGFRLTPTDTPNRFSVAFFDLLSDPAVRGHDTVRIEIEEQDASLWAMLTLTDADQHVTILTSQ
jgi:hypothetical protein